MPLHKKGGPDGAASLFWKLAIPARGFFEENLGQPEAAAGDLAGVVIVDQGKAFLPHLGLENLPCLLRDLLGIELGAWARVHRGSARVLRRLGRGRLCGGSGRLAMGSHGVGMLRLTGLLRCLAVLLFPAAALLRVSTWLGGRGLNEKRDAAGVMAF